jgi:membrane-associated phospholipid phosphatase
MHWLQTLDTALFRFGNSALQNRFFDWLMPLASGNPAFAPVLLLLALGLLVKGNARGRVMLLMLVLILPLGDSFICNTIKHATLRLRPYAALAGVHQLVLAGRDNSMPSSHAANWAAATMIVFIYLGRRSLWYMVPLALTVSYSRIYNGVHYPGDVLAGWILGAGYAATGVWTLDQLWRGPGKRWFPIWQQRLPSLLSPAINPAAGSRPAADLASHWLRLGHIFIAVTLLARLAYLAAGVIDLSEDETYYWLWSKHLALSYYSKPPLIAGTIWLGTHLFGDTAFGVRCLAPVIAAAMSFIGLRFLAREVNARAGFFLLLIVTAAPMLAVGATLMTIDPLSVLFWTAAVFAGWRAVREDSTTRDWLWVGLWMGLGFLSKYTGLFQLLCWAVFFALWRPARAQLRRPGPWLALLVNALCALPVLVWNQQHGWITVHHVAGDAHAGEPWHFRLHEFLANECLLLNPVFFVAAVWAAIAFWSSPKRTPLQAYLFSMGAPLFLVYLLWSCHSRVMPNWIAPSILPLFCLAITFWDGRIRPGWLAAGLMVGFTAVLLLHQPALVQRLIQRPLPFELARVCAWRESGEIVRNAALKLEQEPPAKSNRPGFIIGGHYGVTSQLAFRLRDTGRDFYCLPDPAPKNQFYFWPGYAGRHGEDAVYVQVLGNATPQPPPAQLTNDFASVTPGGVFPVNYRGQTIRWLQLYECRNLH